MTLTSFFTDVSSEMLFNLLPLFLSNVLGVPTSFIGLIEGLAETTASLLKAISGWLSDRLGQRKNLVLLGYGLSTLAKPFLYFSTAWTAVLAVRLGDRIGKGIRTAPRDALIADSVQAERRGLAFGLHRAGDTAGAMCGLLIALGLVWAMQAETLTLNRETFQLLVLVSTLPAVLALLVILLAVQEIKPTPSVATEALIKYRWQDLSPRFRSFLLIVVLFTLGNSSDGFLVLRAQERGLNVVGILGMLVTFNFVYAALSSPLGRLSDRLGRKNLLIGGWLFYGLVYAGFSLSTSAYHVWALYGLYGLYYAATEGVAKALIADLVPSEQRGTAYGFYHGAVGLTALPSSLLAGLLWQRVSPRAPFLLGALLAFVAVGLLRLWKKP
jgi:MFS family permease